MKFYVNVDLSADSDALIKTMPVVAGYKMRNVTRPSLLKEGYLPVRNTEEKVLNSSSLK